MARATLLALICLGLLPTAAEAQSSDLLVLIVDPGPMQVNQPRLQRAIDAVTPRSVIRMTDERAQRADARLSIAFSRPDRWVLRYEAGGQVAWTSDRIRDANALRNRLAELSRMVIDRVDGRSAGRQPAARPTTEQRGSWDDELILALQHEILDPFADMPEQTYEPVTILWSEVVDPFANDPPRAEVQHVWSEVLDPWAGRVRLRR